ncbi:hypothetical protein MIND_00731800 [Mycena indigotica]|uniref:Galactose oxidase n=1 Tax=Mycena indigotica TaxID=2126181 RepID=A0A8H6SL74_9AGAR|nr:uncharacterized protein MIND_00731800 [Mycena indigotica]KAF7301663.1 hypothetical protein MIND_00731800 [Mycena indigotica]
MAGARRVGLIALALTWGLVSAISSSPAPPLQWLNLSNLLKGTTRPPPLKNAAIGYDDASRTLIIFGGEASSGIAQGNTYLLDLKTLTWSIPNPPNNLKLTPPARSAAVFGVDSAASNRHGFIVIGGKGVDGVALDDAWEFDFTNGFWSEIHITPGHGPAARWGASGGIDTRVAAVSDPVLPGPNNTFWYWGGSDPSHSFSELWRLNVSGTLSSNLPDNVVASWEQIHLPALPLITGQGGSVLKEQVVTMGGCNATSSPDENCAIQATYLINGGSSTDAIALNCPAPRLTPVVIPNGNTFSASFASQMFVMLGTFNSSLWDDGAGLKHGEVAIVDTMTRSWTRILPAGDPGTSGKEAFPTPRAGAIAVMFPISLVGDARSTSSDIIVFGGVEEDGTYLSELWLLRSYNAVVTEDDPSWAGFGDGTLQTGVNAAGAGVQNIFITSCASQLTRPSPPISSPSNPSSSSDNSTTPSPVPHIDTSVLHKSLAPVSAALLLPSFLVYRHCSRYFSLGEPPLPRFMFYLSIASATVSYGLGVAALAIAFTSIRSSTGVPPRHLSTTHGQAGLALFVLLYGLVPLTAIFISIRDARKSPSKYHNTRTRANSDASEKDVRSARSPSPTQRRVQTNWRKGHEDSFDTGSAETGDWLQPSVPSSKRTFEVLNRPARTRRASSSRPLSDTSPSPTSQSLGDVEWLNRRRSLTIVGELENSYSPPPPVAPTPQSNPATLIEPPPRLIPSKTLVLARVLFHVLMLAFCVFTLVALWSKAPKGAFAAFLVVVGLFYATLAGLAWSGRPDRSILAILLHRMRAEPPTSPPRPSVSDTDESGGFPYTHRPPYRAALATDYVSPGTGADTEDEDDDRAEEEMRRRDISMWTSQPKRALVITNPSPS